jgi:hypothetical protein
MAPMHRRKGRILILAARAARRLRIGIVTVILLALTALAPEVSRGQTTDLTAQIGDTPAGQVMPPGFVGISFEYRAMHVYTGRNPTAVNPVLVQLLRGINPGQSPVLRIGGNSTDQTWWPMRGVIPPGGVSYSLTKGWLRTTQALAAALGAHLIMGINLAANRPGLAAAEARAILQGIGKQYIQALEVGNEPDLYGVFAWYKDRRGRVVYSRPPGSYDFDTYVKDFSRWRAALPNVPLAGPAFSSVSWMPDLGSFLTAEPVVQTVTFHRYPLRGCTTDPASPLFTSPANLLSDEAAQGLAQQVASFATVAHEHNTQFRLDELNSASCRGRFGVSNTQASALWVLDTLFNLASVGVDGVNIHTLPQAPYEPFTFTLQGGTWSAFVHPVYYGMLMFAQAFPPGGQLLPVTMPAGEVKVWATTAPDGHERIVAINKQNIPAHVTLQVAGGHGDATVTALTAPSITSVSGVTLGGQTFGLKTTTGTLPGPPQTTTVPNTGGSYSFDIPPATAFLLTL